MEYIETEMRKRRGGAAQQDDEDEDDKKGNRGLVDIYEELYRIPDRLKVPLLFELLHYIDIFCVIKRENRSQYRKEMCNYQHKC
jgi:hypothetical protein